jgi:hypothetical protein
MGEEILIAKKEHDNLKFKVTDKKRGQWTPSRYEKIIAGRDYNLLALLFLDLENMGYKIDAAYHKFKQLKSEETPELWFLK